MQKEIWKDIPDSKGYQASNLGNIKSLERKVRNGKYLFVQKEKPVNKHLYDNGYYYSWIAFNNKSKLIKVSQLVAMAFLNHVPCGMELVVNHINFITTDDRLENLEIITQRQNSNHRKNRNTLTGAYWNKKQKSWYSRILINGKDNFIGYFKTEIEAAEAYKNKLKTI